MSNRSFFIAFLFLLNAFNAIGQKTTAHGFPCFPRIQNPGPKVTYGNTVLLNVDTWLNDSLIQSTKRDAGGAREVNIPDSSMFNGKIPAVFDALLMMAKGDSMTVIQPVDSMMKKSIPKEFGEVKEIRYEVKLEDIISIETLAQRQIEKAKAMESTQAKGRMVAEMVKIMLHDYKTQRLKGVKKTASGLEYVIIEQGAGAGIKDGDSVPTGYYGVLQSDGVMFDNSYDRGEPTPFTVGGLIPGFNEGMKLLNRGGKALLFIPSALAYGEQGAGEVIPPNSALVFFIELGQ